MTELRPFTDQYRCTTCHRASHHPGDANAGHDFGHAVDRDGKPLELTHDQLQRVPAGAPLHFTNWPGRASVTVVKISHPDGNVRMPDGRPLSAMPDELTWIPRAGLEVHGNPGNA